MTKLPNDWIINRLEDLCEPGKQAIVDGPFGSNLKRSDYVDSGIPVLKIQNIKENVITLKKMDYVKPEKYEELVRHSFTEGDIVMTKLGDPLGVSAIVNGIPNGLIVADLVRIRPSKVLTKFLCYQLNSPRIQKYINEQQKGTTRPRVNLAMIRELPIYTPPIEEQHKIVELLEDHLSRLDAALADLKQAKIKAAQFRSSILQSAFNRGLATEHNKSAWTTAQLSELVDIGWGDLQVTKKSYVQTGYLAYSATGADGFLPYFDYDSEGIIVSAIGANCGKIFRANGKWSCIKNTMRILPKSPSVLLDYLFHYLSDSSIFPKRGSGQPFIGQQDAREIEISFPSIAEQKKIIEFVEYSISRLDSSMKLAEEMEIQSTGLRRSLLQAAFTGQLAKEVVSV